MTAIARDEHGVLFELFAADARAAAATLKHGISLVADGGAKPDSVMDDLLSAARSVRSAGRIVAIDAAAQIAVGIENCLLRVQQRGARFDTATSSALLAGVDAIERMGEMPAAQLPGFGVRHAAHLAEVVRGLDFGEQPVDEPPEPVRPTPEQAQAAASVLDAGLLSIFKLEAENCVAALNSGLVRLEAGDASSLEGLMRAAHSFKGALRVVGFAASTRLAHALEDCFVSTQQG
ncbi:MAG TPA: Hpt domain-containing protein, partial [Polyangiaceae bacterium]|nr:Hpt domain-containing protein [Polyangiaceae bacterium]